MSELPRPIPWLEPRRPPFLPEVEGSRRPRRHLPILQSAAPIEASAKTAPAKKPKAKGKLRPGSGIPARPIIRALVWARRVSQGFFLFLFLFLLYETEFRGTFGGSGASVRMPYPVEAFLSADPFVAAITFLSTHTVYRGLAWAIAIVALTLLFGRVFCGWICPFGTLHHLTAWIRPKSKGLKRVQANLTRGWQRIKYYVAFVLLAAALTGSAIGGLLDPICVMVRSVGMTIMPAVNYVADRALGKVQESNVRALQDAADDVHGALQQVVLPYRQYNFHEGWLIAILFIGILVMNRVIPRFWCRVLCPLGAFLGWISRFALFGMEKDHAKCTDCNLCLVHCQGADSPQGGVKWRQDECHMCMNCEAACPEDVIKFRFLPNRKSRLATADLDRRKVLATVGAGAVLLPITRVADSLDVNYNERLIRPPGAVEERAFLERCIRCAECMKVCPNNALHPALFEGSLEGLWTPMFIMRIGYCEPSCVLCGDVCPTGAIQKITEKQKLGIGQPPIKIGTAFYDQGRCLPWAMDTPCIVCEEFCPTSPKAIWVEEVDRVNRRGQRVHLQRPHVDPALCIGCGACEKVCPVQDEPAVYVTSIGETRSRTNVIVLENTSYDQT